MSPEEGSPPGGRFGLGPTNWRGIPGGTGVGIPFCACLAASITIRWAVRAAAVGTEVEAVVTLESVTPPPAVELNEVTSEPKLAGILEDAEGAELVDERREASEVDAVEEEVVNEVGGGTVAVATAEIPKGFASTPGEEMIWMGLVELPMGAVTSR